MKTILAIVLLTSVSFAQQEQRFVVTQVENIYANLEFNRLDVAPLSGNKSVLRIDTKTGDVWMLVLQMKPAFVSYDTTDENGPMHFVYTPVWERILDEVPQQVSKNSKPVHFDFRDMPKK